jgi:hypothetical protein
MNLGDAPKVFERKSQILYGKYVIRQLLYQYCFKKSQSDTV